jgi:DNA-directed RNA polymerase subunit H (RpoH/RPB5)
MTSNNRVLQIYNSRNTILELLHTKHNYNIDEYKGFSINEIDAMIQSNQLDMLLTHTNSSSEPDGSAVAPYKTYIKYYIKSSLNEHSLQPIIEDLFIITDTLTSKDILIVILDGEPNESLQAHLKYKWNHDGIFVVVHNIKRLQFNILEHNLVPSNIRILNAVETDEIIRKYHLKSTKELPEISRFDPMALAICIRPGEICAFDRKSPTALVTTYYRICV